MGKVAAQVRAEQRDDPLTLARVTALYDLSEAIDRLHYDPDRSEHTVAQVSRVYLDGLDRITAPADDPDSPLRTLIDGITAAVASSADPTQIPPTPPGRRAGTVRDTAAT